MEALTLVAFLCLVRTLLESDVIFELKNPPYNIFPYIILLNVQRVGMTDLLLYRLYIYVANG